MAQHVLDQIPRITEELSSLLDVEMTLYKPNPKNPTIMTNWEKLVMDERMTTAEKLIRFLGSTDKLRERKDEANFFELKEYSYKIYTKDYQTGIILHVNDLLDNIAQDYQGKIQSLVGNAKRLPAELIHGLILNGDSALAYDSKAFFANDHPVSMTGGTYDNLLSGELSEDNLNVGLNAMLQFPNDRGEIVGFYADTIVIPPALRKTAKKLINSEYTNAASTSEGSMTINTVFGDFDIIIDPLLTDTDDWYLLCTNFDGQKPFIFGERQAPELLYDDTERVKRKILYWSLEYRCAVGYGHPQMAIKFVNTT